VQQFSGAFMFSRRSISLPACWPLHLPAAAQTDSYPNCHSSSSLPAGRHGPDWPHAGLNCPKKLGVPVVIENIGGAAGGIGAQKVLNA
jgi:hypothetical protein